MEVAKRILTHLKSPQQKYLKLKTKKKQNFILSLKKKKKKREDKFNFKM